MEGYDSRRFDNDERYAHLDWTPIDWNKIRREVHGLNRQIREEICDKRSSVDDMVARVNIRINQPCVLTKKLCCIN